MLARALALSALMLTTAFAGCLGGDDPVAAVDDNSSTTKKNSLDVNDSTSAPDGRGDLSAFKETNRTESGAGSMEHKHDYWQGRERIDVTYIDSGLIPFPLMPPGKPTGTAIADYDIPAEDGLIFEGTSKVILTATRIGTPVGGIGGVVPDPEHPQVTVHFDYLTSADEPDGFRTGGRLKLNEPFEIPIKPTEADMPHQVKSLWIFRIYSGEPTWFDFNITVTVVKGSQVVNWPPHPDLYADKATRLLYEGPVVIESKGTIDSNLYGTDANWQHPERIISYGTDSIEVVVSNVQITTSVPVSPSGYLLEFHNATKPPLLGHGAQYGGRLKDDTTDGSTYNFKIAVDSYGFDTPYGQASRWGFRFVPNFDTVGGACVDDSFLQQILVGCQFVPFTLTYDIKIVAHGHSTADDGLPDPNASA